MAEDGPQKGVKKHTRKPTPTELGVLQIVHDATDRVVLTPVFVNGEERFALAVVCKTPADGQLYLRILAHLPLPSDVVLDACGLPGYSKLPPSTTDLN